MIDIIELQQKLHDKTKFLRTKPFKIAVATLLILLLSIIIAPFFFNNDDIKEQLRYKVYEITKSNLTIAGKVDVRFLPSPTITAYDVVLRDYNYGKKTYNLYAKSLAIKFPLFGFGGYEISKISADHLIVRSHDYSNPITLGSDAFLETITEITKQYKSLDQALVGEASQNKSWLFPIEKISSQEVGEDAAIKLPQLVVKEGSYIFYNKIQDKKEIKSINAELLISGKTITSSGSFVSANNLNNFNIKIDLDGKIGAVDSLIKISSNSMKLDLRGDIVGGDFDLIKDQI